MVGGWVDARTDGWMDKWSLLNAIWKYHKSRPDVGYVVVTDELREVSGNHLAVVWGMTNE